VPLWNQFSWPKTGSLAVETQRTLLKNPAKTSQGWLAGFGWSPSLVIVGLSGWF